VFSVTFKAGALALPTGIIVFPAVATKVTMAKEIANIAFLVAQKMFDFFIMKLLG